MTGERGPSVPPASTSPFRRRRVAEAFRAGRAALVVATLVAFSIGHVLLPPDAGARPPSRAATSRSDAALSRLDIAGFRPDGAAEVRRDDERVGATSVPAVDAELDAWGIPLAAGAVVATGAAATPLPELPEIVRFRPRDGWTDVDRNAQLSVRFTTPMDHTTTEAAFRATLDGAPVAGSIRWAEGDTVLVLRPSATLPYGARVELRVDGGALSAAGSAVLAAAAASFTVEARPAAGTNGGGGTTSGWTWPLAGPITQYFGQMLTKYGTHQGIDIDGGVGDPVTAASSGVVIVAGYADECGGLQVRIDHGGGLLTWYRHLSAIDVGVGDAVVAGSLLGKVGATGCAIGSHLHFGVSLDGAFVDPLRYVPRR
jgi:murein DD-endopeptidase MepM/ murein hydrolase activator NlpD